MTPEQMAALEGTEWEALLPVPDRRPYYVPIEYTNFRLQREGWDTACPHPDLEKAIIERSLINWGQKLQNANTLGQKYYYQGRVKYYNEWNQDWINRFGNYDAYVQQCSANSACAAKTSSFFRKK
jgi:hypothetical protein